MKTRAIALIGLGLLGGCDMLKGGGAPDAASCAAPATFKGIQSLVFSQVRQDFKGQAKYVNDLESAFSATVAAPRAVSVNKDIGKVECEGRLTLRVPVDMRDNFGRVEELTDDVGYTVQSSADGKGYIYTIGGFTGVEKQLLAAAAQRQRADGGPAVAVAAPEPARTGQAPGRVAGGPSCQDLWMERNTIYAAAGYCFNSERGRAAFGKGCFAPYGKLGPDDARKVAAIKRSEQALGCKD